MYAVREALVVLGFLELDEEDVPPERYWHSQERVKEWFAAVKQRRRDRTRGFESIPSDGEQDAESYYTDPEVSGLRG